jgi:hypothetical protein
MRRPRFRIRTLLLLVTLFAVLLAGVALKRRHAHFLRLALDHSAHEREARELSKIASETVKSERVLVQSQQTALRDGTLTPQGIARIGGPCLDEADIARREAEWNRELAGYAAEAEWHARLRRKYERAARSPWLPLAPDPPPPK